MAISGDEVVIAPAPKPADPASGRIIDTTMIDGDIDRLGLANVEQLADLFYRSAGPLVGELVDAMHEGSFETQEKLAHKLTGAAGNFGLERLCALLAGLESQAAKGIEASPELPQQLHNEYDAGVAALGDHLSARQALSRNAG